MVSVFTASRQRCRAPVCRRLALQWRGAAELLRPCWRATNC